MDEILAKETKCPLTKNLCDTVECQLWQEDEDRQKYHDDNCLYNEGHLSWQQPTSRAWVVVLSVVIAGASIVMAGVQSNPVIGMFGIIGAVMFGMSLFKMIGPSKIKYLTEPHDCTMDCIVEHIPQGHCSLRTLASKD